MNSRSTPPLKPLRSPAGHSKSSASEADADARPSRTALVTFDGNLDAPVPASAVPASAVPASAVPASAGVPRAGAAPSTRPPSALALPDRPVALPEDDVAGVHLSPAGEVIERRGEVTGLIDSGAYLAQLAAALGEGFGIGEPVSIEVVSSGRSLSIHKEAGGGIVVLRAPREKMDLARRGGRP